MQKINVNNTWNVALIDYFHDLSLVREGDSINFQKASCTLEGCVKVYSSRVESVSSEMAKLLSGLASANADSGAWRRATKTPRRFCAANGVWRPCLVRMAPPENRKGKGGDDDDDDDDDAQSDGAAGTKKKVQPRMAVCGCVTTQS